MELFLENTLKLNRCPHCGIDAPNLTAVTEKIFTQADNGKFKRHWVVYSCARCGGLVTAGSYVGSTGIKDIFPKSETVNDILPFKVKSYLQQAIDSKNSPAGSVMLCASAVDAMLKEKGFKDGKLYSRIKQACKAGTLTPDMETWAHQVRLEANDQRHADETAELPTIDDALKAIHFSQTLAEILFVLPSKVSAGLNESAPK